ncbi:hypothetical protein BCV72DRAFT_310257 [Rhizopus microsporus var. microsporus]|uniref:Enhancer of rudimentary n=1 Tax=Rhizopus microsporus var. microsporus TaxID=86635 RepID=A0A1X0QN82_RHIZD|nr:hypothetical protein BCV72DRAFT_310257 [Rhizopus microsporus var. microsporus]
MRKKKRGLIKLLRTEKIGQSHVTFNTTKPETKLTQLSTESQAFDRIAEMYENQLAKENPNVGQIQYRAEDLFRFIDSHKEFVALVFDPRTSTYRPHDKDWIKDRLIAHFSRQQASAPPGQPRRNNRRYH